MLSTAGLAALAVSRQDTPGALSLSERAMQGLEHLEGYYDVRLEPYVWGIRARALGLAGELEAARALAQKARDAASGDYSPEAAPLREAEALWRQLATRDAPLNGLNLDRPSPRPD